MSHDLGLDGSGFGCSLGHLEKLGARKLGPDFSFPTRTGLASNVCKDK